MVKQQHCMTTLSLPRAVNLSDNLKQLRCFALRRLPLFFSMLEFPLGRSTGKSYPRLSTLSRLGQIDLSKRRNLARRSRKKRSFKACLGGEGGSRLFDLPWVEKYSRERN